jgi:hypothetical protein
MNLTELSEMEKKEIFLIRLGSTWTLDSLYVYMNTPFGFLAFILNVLSFITLRKINFKSKNLKIYLLAYSICLLTPSFFTMFSLFSHAPRYINFSFNYFIGIYRCKLIYWISPSFYFFIRNIDCLILLERISYFVPKLKQISSHNAYNVCFVIFFLSFIINLPYYFYLNIRNESEFYQVLNDTKKLSSFTYCTRETFFFTSYGKLILYFVTIIRDIITLLIELILNFLSIFLFKKYIKEKLAMLTICDITSLGITNTNNKALVNFRSVGPSNNNVFSKLENYNSKLTKMSVCLSLTSILMSMAISAGCLAFLSDDNSLTGHYMVFFVSFFGYIKALSNFLFFYCLNDNFKKFINAIIKSIIRKIIKIFH